MITKTCNRCEKEFEVRYPSWANRLYCSRACYQPGGENRACIECGTEFYVSPYRMTKRASQAQFCSKECLGKANGIRFTGIEKGATKRATSTPTVQDVAWAAGIFEGEGHARLSNNSANVRIGQKDAWLVERLAALFGGTIRFPREGALSKINGRVYPNEQKYWDLTGSRARGFLMTIYKFLSPRRQAQARNALGIAS